VSIRFWVMIGLLEQGFNTTCITKLFPRGRTGAGIIIFAVIYVYMSSYYCTEIKFVAKSLRIVV
jgi:hypothetical protein